MEKKRLEILGLSASHSQSGSFALVLGEETGNRRLPIIIGMFEAQAIAVEMEKIGSNRPMTHDLFRTFAKNFDINIHEIIISDLREGVFFAKILCSFKDGGNYMELDARPSDAVAIGVRFNAPIYAYEPVLKEAGIVLSDLEEEQAGIRKPETKEETQAPATKLQDFSTEKLEKLMQEAIDDEDYERAAKIRDELNKRQA